MRISKMFRADIASLGVRVSNVYMKKCSFSHQILIAKYNKIQKAEDH